MFSLEGDFQIDDFLDEDSDFAQGVFLVNQRFMDGVTGIYIGCKEILQIQRLSKL